MRTKTITWLCVAGALVGAVWVRRDDGGERATPRVVAPVPRLGAKELQALETMQRNSDQSASPREAVGTPSGAADETAGAATETFELAGQVLDERGEIVPCFYVTASEILLDRSGPRANPISVQVTDAEGLFSLGGLTRKDWNLKVIAVGYTDSPEVRVAVPFEGPVRIVLARLASVSGCVHDSRGAPAVGARVRSIWLEQEAVSDEQGAFVLDGLVPGDLGLVAELGNACPSAPLWLELTPGERRTGAALALRTGGRIEGVLIGPDGEPCADATVVASTEFEPFGAGAETDAMGHFVLDALPPGEIDLRTLVEDGTLAEQHVIVRDGETTTVRLTSRAMARARLHGVILVDGRPARAWIDGLPWGHQAPSETYEISVFAPGIHELGLQLDDFHWRQQIDVPAVTELTWDVSLALGHASGRVLASDGHALLGAVVRCESAPTSGEASITAQARADADGRYELSLPAGTYWFEANVVEARASGSAWTTAAHLRVELITGRTLSDVDLAMQPTGTLWGYVHDTDGGPAETAEIRVRALPEGRRLGMTRPDGSFTIHGLEQGTHWIVARSNTAVTKPVRIEIGAGATCTVALVLID